MQITHPVKAKAILLTADESVLHRLRPSGWHFYTFIGGAARFMFSRDTDPARMQTFYRDLKECTSESQPLTEEEAKAY